MSRGFACIALDNPKCGANVGGVMRAAHVYSAQLIVIAGPRFQRFKKFATDVTKAYRHIPTLEPADVFDAIPHDCVMAERELTELIKSRGGDAEFREIKL